MADALQNLDETGVSPVLASARGSNQSGMRAYNERLVLTLIRQRGALPKAEIARMTGLSAQTVSVIMRALEADGFLAKGTPVRGKVGQPSVPMGLKADGAFFFGLKIGRRSLELILTDFEGAVIKRAQRMHKYPSPKNVLSFVNQSVAEMLQALPEEHRTRVAGLGIATPFRLWEWAKSLQVASSEMEAWRDHDIASELSKFWDFPVFLQNDATAACGAELVFGDQDKPKAFLYFYIGFFVGGGLVLEGNLYPGRTGNAAALGSMPMRGKAQGRQLVDVASLCVLEQNMIADGGDADGLWLSCENWDVPSAILEDWLGAAATGLADAIQSAACLIDVECVLLDGWLPSDLRADLVRRVDAQVHAETIAGIEAPVVREGTIGPDARALGAASLPLSERFLVDRNAFLKG